MISFRYITILITGALYAVFTVETDGSGLTFYQVWADYGARHVAVSMNTSSAAVCAMRTIQMYPHARSFTFNSQIYMCISGASLEKTQPPPSSSEGSLFVALNPPTGFSVLSYGNMTACLGFIERETNYKNAAQVCKNMGYYLVTVESLKKVDILTVLAGQKTFWVGCDDRGIEDTFVWQADGTEMTQETRESVFSPEEPSNDENQDCCVYRHETNLLDDFDCSALLSFVCEISLTKCA